jgi:putative ATP-dependent endonuclease of the OLD family
MRLWHLKVERFRGIQSLDWHVSGRVVGLVGAGDATKTTILDAIGLLFTSRFGFGFTDVDFYGGDASAGLLVEGTISELPAAVLADDRLGLDLRGVDIYGAIHDEPGDLEAAVTIRLDVNESLEPTWSIISERHPDGRPLSTRDRGILGVSRVGDNPDRQFTWGRGTALSKMTAATDQLQTVIAKAYREARAAVAEADLTELDAAVKQAELAATQLGAGPVAESMDARLDASPTGASGLGLHSDGIPLGAAGLGTRRLVALGLELLGTPDGAVLCIDEIESGLEPHRLRHLLRTLRRKVDADGKGHGQVLFTTHSPVALEELICSEINVVHTTDGAVSVRQVPSDLASTVRSGPEAFLSRRIVVCEGKTELGVIRGHDMAWSTRHDAKTLAHVGVTTALGNGAETGKRAQQFFDLGYPVIVMADSDASFVPDHNALETQGIPVLRWDGNCAIEERLASDLSWSALRTLMGFLVEQGHLARQIVDVMASTTAGKAALTRAGVTRDALGHGLDDMVVAGLTEAEVRQCFGQAAKGHASWFKRVDLGEMLGQVIADDADAATRDLGLKLDQLESWCFTE